MTRRVHYHYPVDDQYSLASVATDRKQLEESGDGEVLAYRLDRSIYVHYTDADATGTADEGGPTFDAALDELSEDDRSLTLQYLQTFHGVAGTGTLDEDEKQEINEGIAIQRIPAAIEDVDWDAPVVEVAGQLVSRLVSADALPNANHRTAIAFGHLYVASADPEVSFAALGVDEEWRSKIETYIADSKALLTVPENTTTFRQLEEWGCDVVSLNDGTEIELAEYDLTVSESDARSSYAKKHVELWTEFVTESVTRADAAHLLNERGPDRAEFLRSLDGGE